MNYEEIKKLMDDMGNSKIDSLDIEFPEGIKISMKKNEQKVVEKQIETTPTSVIVKNETVNKQNNNSKENEDLKVIKSPMVGTFYESSSPNEEPFVKVGDKVKKGQILCIVEAMKLMNEIESEFDGEIAEICAQDNEIIEYGMPLFKIK